MKRYLRQYGRSRWTIGLSFVAGAIFVAIAPRLNVSSMLGQAGSLRYKSQQGQTDRPTKPGPPLLDNPVSALDEMLIQAIATPPTPEQGQAYINRIAERNMFSRARTAASANLVRGEVYERSQDERQAQQSLPFRLLGTVASSDGDSYAVLEISETKAQDIYCVGQTIAGAHIKSIEQNKVVVVHDGIYKTLGLILTGQPSQETTPAVASVPMPMQTGPNELVRVVANGNRQINTTTSSSRAKQAARSFLSKIKLSPCADGEGLRISGLQDSTMAQLVGLKDGDVIQAVNRHPIGDQRKAVQVLKKARKLGQARLTIVRDDQTRSLAFQTDSW